MLLQETEYFTFIESFEELGIYFEVYLDDYGQSYVLVWKDDSGNVKEWCCGTYNGSYKEEAYDIASYELKHVKINNEEKERNETVL